MTRDAFDMFQEPERGRFGDNERRRRRKDNGKRVTLTLKLHRDNPLSLTVSDPAKPQGRWVSLPKSQIEYRDLGHAEVEVEIPEWLAKNEGLI
jgi:hypothetical protein